MSESVPLWKRALGTIVELEPEAPAAAPPPKTLPPPTAAPVSAVPGVAVAPAPLADNKLIGVLKSAALARKTVLTGVIEQADKLAAVITNDSQRIQAAATVTANVTVESINQAAGTHLADLNNERARFSRELGQLVDTKVTQVQARAANLESQIAGFQAEIERLNASIAAASAQAAEARAQADQANIELAQEQQNFEAAVAEVTRYIETTRDSINGVISKK